MEDTGTRDRPSPRKDPSLPNGPVRAREKVTIPKKSCSRPLIIFPFWIPKNCPMTFGKATNVDSSPLTRHLFSTHQPSMTLSEIVVTMWGLDSSLKNKLWTKMVTRSRTWYSREYAHELRVLDLLESMVQEPVNLYGPTYRDGGVSPHKDISKVRLVSILVESWQ